MSLSFLVAWATAQEPSEKPPVDRRPVTVGGAEDVEARLYVGETPEQSYVEQVSRTNLLASGKRWSAGLQLDQVLLLSNAYVDDFGLETRSVDLLAPETRWPLEDAYANPEKVFVIAFDRAWEVTVGDFYASLGRGIALNVARRTDIDVDTSLTGVRAAYQPGAWTVIALSGLTNPQQVLQDNRNREISPGLAHAVSAARVERYGLGKRGRLDLAVHGVAYTLAARDATGLGFVRYAETPHAVVTGGSAALNGLAKGSLDAFVEVDAQLPVRTGEGATPRGIAAYSALTAYAGSWVLQLEGKRYAGMESVNLLPASEGYELLTPPSLEYERVITEDSAAATNSSDIFGARLRADVALVPGRTVPYASVAVFRDRAREDALHFNRAPETVVHPIVGLQQFGAGKNQGFHTFLNAGARVDRRDVGEAGEDYGSDVQLHADIEIGPVPMEHGFDLAFAVERFEWGNNAQQQSDYVEIESALSWHGPFHTVLVAYVDYSDNPLVKGGSVGSAGNVSDNVYSAGELQWQPNSRSTLKAFYGAYKAGIRCSGGQCRRLPAFEGARVSAAFTF